MSSDRQLNYVNDLQNRDQKLYYVDDASELNSINLEENDKIYAINDNKLFQMEIADQEEELSGSIVSFNGRNNTKIKSLVANIKLMQTGTGNPSPDNVRPISGWTGANIHLTDKNLIGGLPFATAFSSTLENAIINTENKTLSFPYYGSSASTNLGVKFKENTRYTFVFAISNPQIARSNLRLLYTDGSVQHIPDSVDTIKTIITTVSEANKTVMGIGRRQSGGTTYLYYEECGIFEGILTADDFIPYTGNQISINWEAKAGTVYGGTLTLNEDGSADLVSKYISKTETGNGVSLYTGARMRVTAPGFISPGSSTLADVKANYLSTKTKAAMGNGSWEMSASDSGRAEVLIKLTDTINTVALVKEYLAENPLQIVYKLATPRTYHFSDIGQLETLFGTNNIWADIGNITVKIAEKGITAFELKPYT